jgi:hypothetical protein
MDLKVPWVQRTQYSHLEDPTDQTLLRLLKDLKVPIYY